MPDIAPPTTSPSLTDLATRINSEFAAIQKADQDANKNVVQRAITFGRTLSISSLRDLSVRPPDIAARQAEVDHVNATLVEAKRQLDEMISGLHIVMN